MADGFIQVAAGVIVRAGTVLVCQRAAGTSHAGKWEFPGGKLEPGESLEACLHRELQEELGIDATVGEVLWRTRHQYPGRKPVALTFFAVPCFVGAAVNRVFADIRWVPIAALAAVDFLDADRGFVAHLSSGRLELS